MDYYKLTPVTLNINTRQKSVSPSSDELTQINGLNDVVQTNISPKNDYSELVNKYVIIPSDIFTTNFDVLKIDDLFILRNIVCFIFKTFFELLGYHKVNVHNLKEFVKDVCDKYNNVLYHNFYHATHILHLTFILLKQCGLFNKLSQDVLFSILLSALVHDIGHPGNTNSFEINTCSDLAYRYNDLSVLEQYHCTLAFELIKKHSIFQNYSQEEYIICRKTIINCILSTDMANHNIMVEQIKSKLVDGFNLSLISEQCLLAKILVHAADIGNPVLDFEQCCAWAKKVSMEFHLQIEKEKELGFKPFSSFNINSNSSFYNHEIKYIIHICEPYWKLLSEIFNELAPLYQQILNNHDTYVKLLYELDKMYETYLEEF